MTLLLLLASALAGYADPLDGHPVWEDRAVHFFTNAARVAPDAWTEDYAAGGCGLDDFRASERTPKPGMLWNHSLGRAARAHTDDMVENDFFSHTSFDGTAWDARVRRYYPGGRIGENIARGYATSRQAVLSGWMCSAGHRANIMAGELEEIGASARERVYTQNFGSQNRGFRAIASGLHLPESPVTEVTIAVDVWVDPANLDGVFVALDGEPYEAELIAGVDGRGVYAVALPTDGACHAWFAEVRLLDGTAVRYPQHGSWGWGPCAWDDAPTRWLAFQASPPEPEPDPDPEDPTGPGDPVDPIDDPADGADPDGFDCAGCSGVGGAAFWPALLALGLVRRRRFTTR